MSTNSLHISIKHLLLGATLLPSLAFASPISNHNPRAAEVVDAPRAEITPNAVNRGSLDDKALNGLKDPLAGSTRSESTHELTPSTTLQGSLTVSTQDAFVSIDVGDIDLINSDEDDDDDKENCHWKELDGPMDGLQFFMGTTSIRAMNATNVGGNTTQILSKLISTSTDAGVFLFENGDRIKDFYIREDRGLFHGFNFTTNNGKTYVAEGTELRNPPPMVKVPVASGILGRIRVQYCDIGLIGHMGFDFVDDITSVTISNMAYDGFTDNIMPAGPGQTVSVGSQVLDNRNGSEWQFTTLQTTTAVTKSRSVSLTKGTTYGGSLTLEKEVEIPFISKTKVRTEFNWSKSKTNTVENTNSETLTQSTLINLRCPKKKYCVGSSFFTIFKMNVEVEATFRAKTKSGKDFFWKQRGKYEGADSLALQLSVNESDNVIE